MGSGKSSVGKILGDLLACSFIDLDGHIEAREGRSIAEMFNALGEPAFRDAEHRALREVLKSPHGDSIVVALGGGAFVQRRNALLFAETRHMSFFLDAAPSELWRRCRQQSLERPLSHDEVSFHRLCDERRPHYLNATFRIDTTGRDIRDIAVEIAAKLGSAVPKET
jgi:shikimate kinase